MVREPLIRSVEDQVRNRAYELYTGRMEQGRAGSELGDWVEAEQEIVDAATALDCNQEEVPELNSRAAAVALGVSPTALNPRLTARQVNLRDRRRTLGGY